MDGLGAEDGLDGRPGGAGPHPAWGLGPAQRAGGQPAPLSGESAAFGSSGGVPQGKA